MKAGSLPQAFAVFGAGFLMRPFGAIFFGAYVDSVGRRRGLIGTLGIMATVTLLIAAKLIEVTGDKASPGLWLTATGAAGAAATSLLRHRTTAAEFASPSQ